MRIDAYLAERHPEYSRSTWKKRIQDGDVRINGVVETSPKAVVTDADSIAIAEREIPKQLHTLPIIFEDENVLVINKPVGILTHSKGALNDEYTVAEFIKPYTTYKSDTNRPGIIHRLDRATSGVLLLVKNESTATYIARQFSNRTIKKRYIAIVSGHLKQPEAILELSIGRDPSKPSRFRVDAKGKYAETKYSVVHESARRSQVVLEPKTGRTHQLRVHMAYVGAPILGDSVYGSVQAERMYLHAERLEVTLPGGDRQVFQAPAPQSFTDAMT